MHWSLATILLALLFAAASPQRGGRRYLPDQPLEESLSVENHRFQTRGRGNVEDAGRGESRRTRTQETTEINSRSFSGRSRVKSEEPRQFHSRSGKEQETKPAERQVLSRRNQETETRRLLSREETRNERFKSRDATTVTEGPLRKQVRVRGRQSTDGREVEYKTRGTESNRFSSRSQERGEPIRGSQENVRASVGEFQRSGSRDRVQATRRSNVIETPQNIEPVTERFHTRNLALENTQKSKTEDTTEKTVQIDHFTPITEAKIQDLTSRSNSIEPEKRTKPADVSVTEKQHSRQSVRSEVRKSRIDSLEENNEQSRVRGRNKIQEIPTRGAGTESRRRTRPTEATANERFHSRQSAKEEQPSRRGRVHTSPDNLRSDSGQLKGSRRSQDFTSRGNTPEHDRRRTSDVTSTGKFHPRQSVREKSHRVEDWTTEYRALPATTEAGKVPDLPNKEVNTIDVDSKLPTENLISELTTETNLNSELEDSKAVTKQPNLLSTENTVDIPIKSNDVEEPSRASRKLDPSGPERNNHHRGQNRDFENSKRGRLESSLSRERSRTQETSTRGGEGRRASRRFSSQRPESPKDIEDNRGRRKLQRLSSRTKDLDTPIVHGRQTQEQLPARHRLPPTGLGIEERTTEALLLPSPLTESGIDNKVSTVSLSQSEHTNEVTVGVPSESSVATTPRLTERNTNRKPGNRGRGQLKATKILEEKDVSGEVSDDDNYPEVYKQLKKSGTDPKEILVLPP